MGGVPRLNIHIRVQHLALALATLLALATGAAVRFPFPLSHGLWLRLHTWSGFVTAGILTYHLLYLFIRGYVEGRGWRDFPLRPLAADWAEAAGNLAYLLGGRQQRPEAGVFRASQKGLYWGTTILLLSILLTGLPVAFWELPSLSLSLAAVPLLAELHRGLALLFLAIVLWHFYGVLVWEGRWSPEWSWITGRMDAERAREKVPGMYRLFLQQTKEREESAKQKSAGEEEDDQRLLERGKVEEELAQGNLLAKEEKYVEALYHYRRALELYPGYSQARYNMAMVLHKMGETAMALEALKQFVVDDPFHPLVRRAQELIQEMEEPS